MSRPKAVCITEGNGRYGFYDRLERRVAITDFGKKKTYLFCGTEICQQRDGVGTVVEKNYYAMGEEWTAAMGANAGKYYYTQDHLGSTRVMTDTSQAVRAVYDYSPYGVVEKVSGDLDADFLYTGHHYHGSSELHLTLFRAYDAKLGRWHSPDPLGIQQPEDVYFNIIANSSATLDIASSYNGLAELLPEGSNLYSYVANNAANMFDPNGLQMFGYGAAPSYMFVPESAAPGTNEGRKEVAKACASGLLGGALGRLGNLLSRGLGQVSKLSRLSTRRIGGNITKVTKGEKPLSTLSSRQRIGAGLRYLRTSCNRPFNSPASKLNRARARQMFFGGKPPGGISNFK